MTTLLALSGCGSDSSGEAMEPAVPATPATAATAAPTVAGPGRLAPRATANRFDGARAFALLRTQVEDYGWRPAGSPALRRLAVRLRALLPRGSFEDVPGHPGLRNVVGSVPGRMPAIVVGAHYDVEAAPEGFVGANDGAAGTAAVVTLARAFARAPRPRNARALRFVLFDGEEEPAGCEPFIECGLRGSKAYAERHAGDTSAMILLDYIAERRGLSFPREDGSDPQLWARLRSAARAVGVGALFPNRTAGQIIDDHVPFTQRGVPAIDLIDFDYPLRDTLDDDLGAVSQRSLDAVGEAVHRLVARLRVAR
ncbi:MAG: M28 family metallopeptidase [Solirubrobacteraceae bacterium]|nr:M28 family metallopeptidase [Solirubrobacteraceae bacterium]